MHSRRCHVSNSGDGRGRGGREDIDSSGDHRRPYRQDPNASSSTEDRPPQMRPGGQIVSVVLSFSKKSTIHGLNHIAQARSTRRRVFWILILGAASCGFLTNLYQIAIKYLQTPVLTNVKHDHLSFKFPDITVCNINPIHFPPRETRQFENLVNAIHEFHATHAKYRRIFENITNWKKHLFKGFSRNVFVSDFLYMRRDISLYSIPHEIFVQDCRYMGMDKNACSSAWITHRRWPYGACYQLNITQLGRDAISRSNVKAFTSGFRPDLFLLLYKSVDYPSEFQHLDTHGTIKMPSGVLLMLHEQGTYPQISESFLLDKYAQVDLHMTRKQHLRKLQLCESQRDLYDYVDIETLERRYYKETRTDCVENITQNAFKRHCNCINHEYPLKNDDVNYPFCSDFEWFYKNFTERHCPAKKDEEVLRADPLRTCYKDMCEHTVYSTVISQANFPAVVERKTHFGWLKLLARMEETELKKYNSTDLAFKALKLNETTKNINISSAYSRRLVELLNIDFIERNFMYLRIVPSSLFADEMLEDEEYPLSRFLTDVGGCVGLWVGASLITVFEFCDLLLDFLGLKTIRKKCQRRQNGQALTTAAEENKWTATSVVAVDYPELSESPLVGRSRSGDTSNSVQLGMVSSV